MTDLLIYIIEVIVGYQIGCRLRGRDKIIQFLGKLQIVAIMIMLFTMGLRMGSNEEVTSNLGSIGLTSALMTVIIMIFSAFFAFLARKMIGMDRWAMMSASKSLEIENAIVDENADNSIKSKDSDKSAEPGDSSQRVASIMIVLSVIIGLLCGYMFVRDIFGSNEAGLVKCAAISFMYCVMREYFSLLLVPIIAKRIGYMEAIGICGATAMGVNLPIVERATRGDVAIYSFISGIIHTASVPILLPVILSL